MEITQKQQGSQLSIGKQILNSNLDPMATGSNIFSQFGSGNKFMNQGGFMQGQYSKRTNPQI